MIYDRNASVPPRGTESARPFIGREVGAEVGGEAGVEASGEARGECRSEWRSERRVQKRVEKREASAEARGECRSGWRGERWVQKRVEKRVEEREASAEASGEARMLIAAEVGGCRTWRRDEAELQCRSEVERKPKRLSEVPRKAGVRRGSEEASGEAMIGKGEARNQEARCAESEWQQAGGAKRVGGSWVECVRDARSVGVDLKATHSVKVEREGAVADSVSGWRSEWRSERRVQKRVEKREASAEAGVEASGEARGECRSERQMQKLWRIEEIRGEARTSRPPQEAQEKEKLVWFCLSMSLPSPQDVRMFAVDLNYTLRWSWSDSQLNDSVNFTASYTFWDVRGDEESYKQACGGSGERWCDFTHCQLSFDGSFQIRVRAEAAGRHSNWTYRRFTPDEDVVLGPPSGVNMKGDEEMVLLDIARPVMSSVMKLQYEVRYWERLQPKETHLMVYNDLHAALTSLKPWTEYCVQVRVFHEGYNKSSSLTSPSCVSTTGGPVFWPSVLTVLCCLSLVVAGLYMCWRLLRKFTSYQTPNSITGLPLDHPPLLEAQELRCSIALVTAPTPQLQSPQLPLQEWDGSGAFQAVSCQWSRGSEQDSGIGSGEES
ncbi:hypothetical protein NFI96_029699 [Prochilodus magdalenae]|nr:hypothetical protein NFI96_029699 [Prochilodus magdalenae]